MKIERTAMGEEQVIAAYGTAASIAQAIGGKKTKALERFAKAVRPNYLGAGHIPRRGPKGIDDYKAGIRQLMLKEVP